MNTINQENISYEDMLRAGMHFGRKRTVFNPKMEKFVFTVRDGICIIDLIKTQAQIDEVATLIKTMKEEGKVILFVAPTKQSIEAFKGIATDLGMPYVVDRWIGGTLTNFKVINSRVKKLEEMEKDDSAGKLDKYTKKERLMFNREMGKMSTKFEGLKKLTKMPDAIFVSSLKESAIAIREAKIAGIKVIAIANTDANPMEADYLIPANDRSKQSVDLVINSIKTRLL